MNDSQIIPSNHVKPAFVPKRSTGNSLNGVARQARRGKGLDGGVSSSASKQSNTPASAVSYDVPSFVGIAG